jgi:hypothetical protein
MDMDLDRASWRCSGVTSIIICIEGEDREATIVGGAVDCRRLNNFRVLFEPVLKYLSKISSTAVGEIRSRGCMQTDDDSR